MAQLLNGWYLDAEADNLYLQGKTVWYIRVTSLDKTRTLAIKPFEIGNKEAKKLLEEWIESFDDGAYVCFHNGLGYDAWMMWKFFDIKPRVGKNGKDFLGDKHVQFIDTYVLSMYLQPNLPLHSLEYLASGSEDEKMAFRAKLVELGVIPQNAPKAAEFAHWHPLMGDYCDDDVAAGIGVLTRLWAKALEMYKDKWLHPSFRQMQKDYFLYAAQAYSGVKFHQDRANTLMERIAVEMEALRKEVEPELPSRRLKSAEEMFWKMPAKPFKMNGEPAGSLVKWLESRGATFDPDTRMISALGVVAPLQPNAVLPVKLPMEIDDNIELKDYFLASGWVPSDDYWNLKRGPDGKPERDDKGKVIKTTPKIQIAGVIDPALLAIEGEIPKKVVRFLSLRNRQSVVRGWLDNWRMEFDGRLSAEISGYAPTSRVKHKTVNVSCL